MNSQRQKPEFDDIFMHLATQLAQRSHCVRKQVGAVLTRDNRIVSIGYNGPPSGADHCDEKWPKKGCAEPGKKNCPLGMHAEQNAILYAAKNQIRLAGATLYITLSPCIDCARMILDVDIKKVVYLDSYAKYKGLPTEEGIAFLERFGVKIEKHHATPLEDPNV